MAIAWGTMVQKATNGVSSDSINVDLGSSSDRALLAWIGCTNASPTVTSITLGGDSVTVPSPNTMGGVNWYAIRIATTKTGVNSLAVTWSAATGNKVIIAVPGSGIDQTTPFDAQSVTNSLTDPTVITVSSATGDSVVILAQESTGATVSFTGGTALTGTGGTFRHGGYFPGASSVDATIDWSTTPSGLLFAMAANANASASSTPITFTGTVPTINLVIGTADSVDLSTYFSGTETPFTYALDGASSALPSGVTLSSAGLLEWSGSGSAGTTTGVIVQGTDQTPDTADTNSFSIVITAPNSAPSWSGTPSAMSAKRGQALTPQDITSLVSDADLDTLSYSITGAPTGVTINSSTGIISGTPTATPGVYACTVEADDGIASPVSSSSFNITVTQCVLELNSAGYEFGDGNDPATMSVVASTELQVAAYPLTEWPPASAIATATATTGTNGRLADLGDDDLSFGTAYRVIARNAADGETWAWTMAAS